MLGRNHWIWIIQAALAVIASPCRGQSPTIGGCPVFPADNIWNTPVDQLPAAAVSSTYVNTIGPALPLRIDAGSGLWQGGPIGHPFIVVPSTQTKYTVSFRYAGESDPGPYPIPLNAPIEGGSQSSGDRHVIAVENGNCILYEMWSSYPQTASWTAGSGARFNLRSNALRPSGWTSADAAGLPIFAGLVRYDEIVAGEIRHALRVTVPKTRNTFVWPARHFASSLTSSQYPPMGVRFRLRASFDISGFSLQNQVILRALKKYGMILADNGSSWWLAGVPDERWNNDDLQNLRRVTGNNFEVVDVSGLMVDPNSGQARQNTVVMVTVTPPSTSVAPGATKQLSAKVTNSSNQLVSWSVNSHPGGNSQTGWISTSGLYTAPGTVPAGGSVKVEATSLASPSAVGAATIQITEPVLPVVTSLSPSAGIQGTIVPFSITGLNFAAGSSVAISGSGVTVSNVVRLSATQIIAMFVISSKAAGGSRSVTVKTPSGVSGSLAFNVTAATSASPILNQMYPSTITRGKTVSVILRGAKFKAPAAVRVGGAGVAVSNVFVLSDSTITATLQASSSSQAGPRALQLQTPGGVSNTLPLTLQ
jgi:hypothetical protein